MIDSHAHITVDELYAEIDPIIARAKESGVAGILNINTDRTTLNRGLELKQRYPDYIWNAVAVTPHDVHQGADLFLTELRSGQIEVIGETGLDAFQEEPELQREILDQYCKLAVETDLPICFHCRGDAAFEGLYAQTEVMRAVIHCFTGTLEQAHEALERGWYLSISGIVTFKKSEALREVVKALPLERLFIETDAPWLSPQSKRGKPNEPSYIREIAATIAAVKGVSVEEVAAVTGASVLQWMKKRAHHKSSDVV